MSENPDMDRKELFLGTLFCLAGSLIAAAVAYHLNVRPTVQVLDARDWPEVPCVIISSAVGRGGGESTHYSVQVSYEYEVEGKHYRSSRYGFFPFEFGQPGRAHNHLPSARQTVCYVNPDHPTEAVINRGLSSELWWGLIPLVLLLFVSPGVYGLVVRSYLWLMRRPCDDVDFSKFHGDELGREIKRQLIRAASGCCLTVIGIVVVLFVIAWCDVHY